ncbi:CGNR zinc finger domain-containing protein [Hamadaea tsunoensis]|uniref:CGNR zinc finger domain-containing protein n=1 Tax=Hamadaea tsunoensis TaxID=53368 RepID=UPI0004012D26|nr:CGNR zinc finger domain-containing protein [Hamadaea tsunoensis]
MVTDQVAPGGLEQVRTLLNTWLIPNDTRTPTDRFHGSPTLRDLRDDLRRAVERDADADLLVTAWIDRLGVLPVVREGRIALQARKQGEAWETLRDVLQSMMDGSWHRLKACPDCRWIFYDNSRNGQKRWCLMNAGGPNGRACGTIAKVRAYRERNRSDE